LQTCGCLKPAYHKKDWVSKWKIGKVPHLRMVSKSNKKFKSANFRICDLWNLIAGRPCVPVEAVQPSAVVPVPVQLLSLSTYGTPPTTTLARFQNPPVHVNFLDFQQLLSVPPFSNHSREGDTYTCIYNIYWHLGH
jgi:hypothetical protein